MAKLVHGVSRKWNLVSMHFYAHFEPWQEICCINLALHYFRIVIANNLSSNLRRLRTFHKASLRDVEFATGVSGALLCQWESGHVKEPGVFKLHAIAKYYTVSIEELCFGRANRRAAR